MYWMCVLALFNVNSLPGTFWMIISLTEDIKNGLKAMNNLANTKSRLKIQTLNEFYDTILFHSDAKQLSFLEVFVGIQH